ncbi:MAG: alkaline phosphatase family protein [Planctomycetota bacterium]
MNARTLPEHGVRRGAIAGAWTAAFCWLATYLQAVLTNRLGLAPGLLLAFGLPAGLLWCGLGAALGAVPAWIASRAGLRPRGFPAVLLVLVALLFLFLHPFLLSGRQDAVVAPDTRRTLLLVVPAVGLFLILGRVRFLPRGGRFLLPASAALLLVPIVQEAPGGDVARLPRAELDRQLHLARKTAEDSGPPRSVFVFAVDGLSWNILDAMIAGAQGKLATMLPTFSPIIWNTLATGWDWRDHGVREFTVVRLAGSSLPLSTAGTALRPALRWLRPLTGPLGLVHHSPVTAISRMRRSFWEVFEEAGVPCSVVGWFASFPASRTGGGFVSDLAFTIQPPSTDPQDYLLAVHPEELGQLAASIAASETTRKKMAAFQAELEQASGQPLLPHERKALEPRLIRFFNRMEITRRLIQTYPHSGLFTVYTRLLDDVQHLFWIFYQPDDPAFEGIRLDPEQRNRLQEVIPLAYRWIDRYLGEFLSLLPPQTGIVILSDHSAHAQRPARPWQPIAEQEELVYSGGHMDAPPGVLALSGPGIQKGVHLEGAGLLSFLPTLAFWLRVPLAENLPGQVLRGAFTQSFLLHHRVRPVPTYELEGLPRPGGTALSHLTRDQRHALEELGYLQ